MGATRNATLLPLGDSSVVPNRSRVSAVPDAQLAERTPGILTTASRKAGGHVERPRKI